MKKRLTYILITSVFISLYGHGQTILFSGDAWVVGVNTNMAGGADEISLVFFKDISTGTQFELTDNGYAHCNAGTWGETEGTWQFTRTGASIPAGTVVTFRNDGTAAANWICVSPDNNWTYTNMSIGPGQLNLNSSSPGDQLYILQGGTWTNPAGANNATYNGRIIHGFNLYEAWLSAGLPCSSTSSYQHPLCCHFFTNTPGANNLIYAKFNAGAFASGDINDWITRINNPSNWTVFPTNAAYVLGAPNYVGGYAITLTQNYYSNAQWRGTVNTDWFNCNNWDVLKVPEAQTDVNLSVSPAATNNCMVGVIPNAAGNITTAYCNSINWSWGNAVNRSLGVNNAFSLLVSNDVLINKTASTGLLTFDITNASVFSCQNLTIQGVSGNPRFNNNVNTNNVTINGNLLINGTGGYNNTNGIIKLYGNYTNNNSSAATVITGSTFRFLGSNNQTINTNNFLEDFATLVVNKPGGMLFVNCPLEIKTNMTFTNGIVDNSQRITFIDNATATSMSNNSFCLGEVAKIGNDIFTFPIGADNFYAPAAISAPGNLADRFVARYYKVNSHPLYSHASKVPALDNLSDCEYWTIDREAGTSAVNVTLSWENARHTGPTCHVFVLPDLRVARWDGSMWQNHGNGATTGTPAAGTVTTSAPVTAFSPFTISSSTNLNPLPVDLLYFNGTCINDKVELVWESANEAQIDKYILFHSVNGTDYNYLTSVDAQNNFNTTAHYKYTHYKHSQHNYYKLRAVDYNGAYTEFQKVVYVSADITEPDWQYTDNQLIINNPANYRLTIFDVSGRLIYNTPLMPGHNRLYLNQQTTGIYFIVLENDQHQVNGKIFISSR